MKTDQPKNTLTVAQLASRYAVNQATISRWYRAGRIPAPLKAPGGRLLWRRSSLELFEREGSFEVFDSGERHVAEHVDKADARRLEAYRKDPSAYREAAWSEGDKIEGEQSERRTVTFGASAKTAIVVTAESVAVNLPRGTRLEIDDDVATELVGRQVAEFVTLTDDPETQ